jgi:hypothetical protein
MLPRLEASSSRLTPPQIFRDALRLEDRHFTASGFTLQRHPVTRLYAHRVSGERVNPLVFIVSYAHPARSRCDTSGDCSRFVLFVENDKDYSYGDGRADHSNTGIDLLARRVQRLRPGWPGNRDAEYGGQNHFPKVATHGFCLL